MSAARAGKGRARSAAGGKPKAAKPAKPAKAAKPAAKSAAKPESKTRKPRSGQRAKRRPGGVSRWWRWAWPVGMVLVIAAVALAWLLPGPGPAPAPPPPQPPKAAKPAPPRPAPPAQPPAATTPPSATKAHLPYEEPLSGADLSQRLVAVDEALFAALGRAGLGADRIRLTIAPQADGELTKLSVRLAPGQDPAALAHSLGLALRGRADQVQTAGQAGGAQTILVHLGPRLTHQVSLEPSGAAPAPAPPAPSAPRPPAAHARPRVAIVIDDLGHSLEAARKLLALDLPLDFSVLPYATHGRQVAQEASAQGREVLLHLPMEPKSYPSLSPGPGALLASMDAERLRQATQAALAAVPGAVGVNNHMGSRLTEDRAAMQAVCEVLRPRGLFFLDSLTSPRSQAWQQAQRMGLAFARRDVFLDNDPSSAAVTAQIARLIELAKARGQAIAIGHPHPATIQALAEQAERLRREVDMVPVSRLLTRPGAAGS
ncbi:MAG: divergent polysaccharide deacetylase family protein [Pseudomonadota bacterium]